MDWRAWYFKITHRTYTPLGCRQLLHLTLENLSWEYSILREFRVDFTEGSLSLVVEDASNEQPDHCLVDVALDFTHLLFLRVCRSQFIDPDPRIGELREVPYIESNNIRWEVPLSQFTVDFGWGTAREREYPATPALRNYHTYQLVTGPLMGEWVALQLDI